MSQADLSILEWYIEQGVTDVLENAPVNRLAASPALDATDIIAPRKTASPSYAAISDIPLGAPEAKKESLRLAQSAQNLKELHEAIRGFDGLAIKKTATHLVFGDGQENAPIMIIGDAPGDDDDAEGKAFSGRAGQLLDKMMSGIGFDRNAAGGSNSFYITNILNWRPPGNRSPTPAEIEISLPFIEKHIALVQPKLLVCLSGIAAKSLLNSDLSLSKLRGSFTQYRPVNDIGGIDLPCLVTLHPANLLKTPAQKKYAWADLLLLSDKMRHIE